MASRTSQNIDAEKEIQYSPRSIEDTAEVSLTSPYVSTPGLSEPLQSFHSQKKLQIPRVGNASSYLAEPPGRFQPMDIPPVTIQGIDLERVSSVKGT